MLTVLKSKIVDKKKQVSFFGGSEDSINEQEALPTVILNQKPKISTIKKLWDAFSNNAKYDELKQYLDQCEQKGRSIEEFFNKEGRLILSLTMMKSFTGELEFIYENISSNLIRSILGDNPDILESFFLRQIDLEEHNEVTSDMLNLRMKRLELLLKMGTHDLLEAALTSIKQPKPEGVLNSFNMAVAKWQKGLITEQTSPLTTKVSSEFFKTHSASLSSSKLDELVDGRPKRPRDEMASDIPEDVSETKRFKESEIKGDNEMHKVKLPEEENAITEKSNEYKPTALFPSLTH